MRLKFQGLDVVIDGHINVTFIHETHIQIFRKSTVISSQFHKTWDIINWKVLYFKKTLKDFT